MITLADISEYQQSLNAGSYLAAGHHCIIVRAHNGYRPDNMWPGRRDYLRKFPFVAVGYYQYLVGGRPSVDQAEDLIGTLGTLAHNEFVICDSEEGSGFQGDRVREWTRIIDSHFGFPSTVYASESWWGDKLGGASNWQGRPRWVAAYRSSEPTIPHELWQNNDHSGLPGIVGDGGDGNIFNGSDLDFARIFLQPQ